MDEITEAGIADIETYNGNFHSLLAQDMDRALIQCQKIKQRAESIGYEKGVIDAVSNRAWYHLWRCEFSQAFPLLRDLPEQYKRIGDDFGYLVAINSLGVIHLDMGNYTSALPYFLKSLKLAREKNEREREASVLANLGLLYEGMDKVEVAYDYYTEALNIPERNDTCFYTASKCVALYHIKNKTWPLAQSTIETAIQIARDKQDRYFESELLVTRGIFYRRLGENHSARDSFTTGLQICKQLGNKRIEAENLYQMGCLVLDEENLEAALSCFQQVAVLAEGNEIGSFMCKAYEKLSTVYEQKGEYYTALQYLKRFYKAEKEHDLKKAELKLKSLAFEHELEKKKREVEIYRLKNLELEEANHKILELANHDNLTGLPNRRLFMEHLGEAVRIAHRNQTKLALLFVDLDNFKPVNDRFGHAAGDHLLRDVSARLASALRESDIVARFGGDEFVILLNDLKSSGDIHAACDKVMAVMHQAFEVNGHQYQLSSSIGVSIYPDHSRDVEDLIGMSDKAMYRAKTNGKDRYTIYG